MFELDISKHKRLYRKLIQLYDIRTHPKKNEIRTLATEEKPQDGDVVGGL